MRRRQGSAASACFSVATAGICGSGGFSCGGASDLQWRWQVSAVVDVFLLAVTDYHVDVDAMTCSAQYSSGLIKCRFVASLVEKPL
jgi:hypothetical protein